jgi:hypothetical protein
VPTFSKDKLSGSPNGRGIKIAATSTPGTSVHTAVAGSGQNNYDEIYLYAYNSHTADVVLTIEFGGTMVPDDNIKVTIPWQSGLQLILPGLILQNECEVAAFASVASVIVVFAFINNIAP